MGLGERGESLGPVFSEHLDAAFVHLEKSSAFFLSILVVSLKNMQFGRLCRPCFVAVGQGIGDLGVQSLSMFAEQNFNLCFVHLTLHSEFLQVLFETVVLGIHLLHLGPHSFDSVCVVIMFDLDFPC